MRETCLDEMNMGWGTRGNSLSVGMSLGSRNTQMEIPVDVKADETGAQITDGGWSYRFGHHQLIGDH